MEARTIVQELAARASPYHCQSTANLPFGGAEILVLSFLFLFLVVTLCVTFIDVGLKQMWPGTFLDPAVAARVAQIRKEFPKITPEGRTAKDAPGLVYCGQPIASQPSSVPGGVGMTVAEEDLQYTSVVSSAPYVAGLAVDEDLIYVLANGDAFGTVSDYCSSTVRGYAMLSSTLLCAGICLGYLWVHNAAVFPSWGQSWPGYAELLGYVLIFLTGIVMCGPCGNTVFRNANIVLFTSVPTNSAVLKLHGIGVGGFVALGLLAHGYAILTQGSELPDFAGAVIGVLAQLIGAVAFAVASLLAKWKIYSDVMGKKVQILAEIACLFATFLAYIQWVIYPASVCANYSAQFQKIMIATVLAPFAVFVVKHYGGGPTSFATPPSLMLMNHGVPVATSGPVPVLQYDQNNTQLPVVHGSSVGCAVSS